MQLESDSRKRTKAHVGARPRWWNTLAFRLGAVIDVTVLGICWPDSTETSGLSVPFVAT